MSEKSHVGMGQHQCPVCDKIHEREMAILLYRRLKNTLDRYQTVGAACCEEHHKDGFVTLIEGEIIDNGSFKRLERLCHIKKELFEHLFNVECPPNDWCVCPTTIFDQLEAIQKPIPNDPAKTQEA